MVTWQRVAAAAAAAVVMAGGAVAVEASASRPSETSFSAVASAPAPRQPEMSQGGIGPARPAAGSATSDSTSTAVQTIGVAIVGGELELTTDRAEVVLQRVPGSRVRWEGTLPPARVVDARGTHEGWSVLWTVEAIDLHGAGGPGALRQARVRLEPGAPVVVAGDTRGLVSGEAGPLVSGGRMLFSAEPGTGGGTYEAGGVLSLRLPANPSPDQVTVVLSFSLA